MPTQNDQPVPTLASTKMQPTNCAKHHHANYLLHGHTHIAGEHGMQLDESTATRLVLNAWDQQGHYLSWSDDGLRHFHQFDTTPQPNP